MVECDYRLPKKQIQEGLKSLKRMVKYASIMKKGSRVRRKSNKRDNVRYYPPEAMDLFMCFVSGCRVGKF